MTPVRSTGADGSAELVSTSNRTRPPARRPRFGFDALTATERKVVDFDR
jgi:hypothetical protein